MTQTQFVPPEATRTDVDIGLVFADQRTGDLRKVVYADDRIVLVRDEGGHSTLIPRDAFLAALDSRYRRRYGADPEVDGGPFDRLLTRLSEYDEQGGRKAKHKADALREAMGFADDAGRAHADTRDEEGSSPEVTFEDVDGIGPKTAAKLRAAGFVTEDDVRRADDDALLGVPGVGPSNLAALRGTVAYS